MDCINRSAGQQVTRLPDATSALLRSEPGAQVLVTRGGEIAEAGPGSTPLGFIQDLGRAPETAPGDRLQTGFQPPGPPLPRPRVRTTTSSRPTDRIPTSSRLPGPEGLQRG